LFKLPLFLKEFFFYATEHDQTKQKRYYPKILSQFLKNFFNMIIKPEK